MVSMQYEESIPESAKVNSHCHNILISQFHQWKGLNYVPTHVHPAISWSPSDPFPLSPGVNDSKWILVDKKNTKPQKANDVSTFVPARTTKHKSIEAECDLPKAKKLKPAVQPLILSQGPPGLIWDGKNFSCAYDSLFTVLHNIWSSNPNAWSTFFQGANQYLSALSNGFNMHLHERMSLEGARDDVLNYYIRETLICFQWVQHT
jgi:hypothetical protein